MVSISKVGSNFVFEVEGLHKLWALKSQLTIPAAHIIKAIPNTKNLNWFIGLRMPGTHVPGLITAGTYLASNDTIFCDVSDQAKSIMVELQDEHYTKLIIEVENPAASIKLLTQK